MKIVYIILLLLFSGFVFSQIYIERSTSNTEEVEYVVLKQLQKGVEIRKYSKLIVACTQIPADNYSNVSSQGFR
ncbi:MAG: heme-binding protein, partial [Crocinitomicaceae bacterium]